MEGEGWLPVSCAPEGRWLITRRADSPDEVEAMMMRPWDGGQDWWVDRLTHPILTPTHWRNP